MHVVGRNGEAVRFVLRALKVGQVDGDFVAHFGLDRFRRDVRTDQRAKTSILLPFLTVFPHRRGRTGCGLSVRESVPTL
jgi:hypothetical protein